jgi:putative SOS response-associated peptidase YedK
MAIITRDAHVAPGEVHDRMPACLTPDTYDDWLGDHLSTEEVLKLLDFTSLEVANQLSYYPVSKAVNSVKNDGPQLIEEL